MAKTKRNRREFADAIAVRGRVPLLIGMTGPSGGGKTYSALRVATGIKKIVGGKVFLVDTEANRAKHYADHFDFHHVPFAPPFAPLDYLDAIEHCVAQGATVVIVDSTSHEWEGEGGVLEMQHDELDRIAGDDWKKRERCVWLAWQKPKREHRRLINRCLQLQVHFIFCFRAKEKIKITKGKEPTKLGWMPIAGIDMVYEFAVNCLLPPGADGVPEWKPGEEGSKQLVKLPIWARDMFAGGKQLDEEVGEKLAQWAEGDDVMNCTDLLAAYEGAIDTKRLDELKAEGRKMWQRLGKDERASVRNADADARERLDGAAA